MKDEKIYRGLLRYKDGREEVVPVPGVTKENDTLFIPESITVGDKYFVLDKEKLMQDYFEYREIIPYKDDLH